MNDFSVFDTVCERLLHAHGLGAENLSASLDLIGAHHVDYADIYCQRTAFESWHLEEGMVKSGSFQIDQGVGVRAVSGEKTAFAYADSLTDAAVRRAAETVRVIGAAGNNRPVRVPLQKVAAAPIHGDADPIASLDSPAKVALLQKVEALAKAADPRIVQVMAGLTCEYDLVYIARLDGRHAADIRPLVRLSVTVIAEQNGRREQGSGRRESYSSIVLPRMTNTFMENGSHDPQEIIASIDKGIYAVNFGGGQVDITNGKFVFSASEAWWVEKGKLQYPVKGSTIVGSGPEVLKHVSMIGNDSSLDAGVGVCGKDGQSVPVGVGQPTLRIDAGLTVGGSEA